MQVIKLESKPFTDQELYSIAQMEGDFDENYKLALEARNNHYVIK